MTGFTAWKRKEDDVIQALEQFVWEPESLYFEGGIAMNKRGRPVKENAKKRTIPPQNEQGRRGYAGLCQQKARAKQGGNPPYCCQICAWRAEILRSFSGHFGFLKVAAKWAFGQKWSEKLWWMLSKNAIMFSKEWFLTVFLATWPLCGHFFKAIWSENCNVKILYSPLFSWLLSFEKCPLVIWPLFLLFIHKR